MADDALMALPATQLAAKIRSRDVSPVEATDAAPLAPTGDAEGAAVPQLLDKRPVFAVDQRWEGGSGRARGHKDVACRQGLWNLKGA